MPERIQLSRQKGWRMPENTVKVDRTTKWGNPFRIDEPPHPGLVKIYDWKLSDFDNPSETAVVAVRRFGFCMSNDDASIYAARQDLSGKNLACWCAIGQPCHADVLLELANPKSGAQS